MAHFYHIKLEESPKHDALDFLVVFMVSLLLSCETINCATTEYRPYACL